LVKQNTNEHTHTSVTKIIQTSAACRYPADQIPLHTGLSSRQGRHTITCPTTSNPVSLLRRSLVLPRVPRLQILSLCLGGLLWRCHVFRSSGSYLLAQEGSDAATCLQLWILPSCSGGLRRCHVSCGSGSCLPAQEVFIATMCPAALDPASLHQISMLFYDTFTGTAIRAACCGLFVKDGLGVSDVFSYGGTLGRRGFMWFRPPERNTLRPRENRCVVLLWVELSWDSLKRACLDLMAALSFYSTRQGSYKKICGPTCGPEVVEIWLQHLGY
jgi:hypothetical protein